MLCPKCNVLIITCTEDLDPLCLHCGYVHYADSFPLDYAKPEATDLPVFDEKERNREEILAKARANRALRGTARKAV